MSSQATAQICRSTTIPRKRKRTRNRLVLVLALLCACCLFDFATIVVAADVTASPACQDNADFRYQKKDTKTCEWVDSHPKKERLCSTKRSIAKHCPVACGYCNKSKTFCPKNKQSRKFKTGNIRNGGSSNAASCSDYESGLECGFRHVWTGCHKNNMVCTPTVTYSCNTQDEWQKDDTMIARITNDEICKQESSTTLENKPYYYGEGCDPKECPHFAPLLGSSCKWYKGSNSNINNVDCYYDYQVTGCNDLELECSPKLLATCDTFSQTWQHAPYEYFCPTESQPQISQISEAQISEAQIVVVPTKPSQPKLPIGDSCDPLTFSHCPFEEPSNGSRCTFYQHQPDWCKYGWEVMGCTKDDLFCGYTSMGFCSNFGMWESYASIKPQCPNNNVGGVGELATVRSGIDDGREEEQDSLLPIGDTCDPTECPLLEPTDGDYCGDWEGKEDPQPQECFYGFALKGCTSESLTCTSSRSYTCETIKIGDGEYGYIWAMEEIPQIECIVDDPLYGTECDPNDNGDGDNTIEIGICPENEPKEGTDCEQDRQECFYGYALKGCTSDDLTCMPSRSYSCGTIEKTGDGGYTYKWTRKYLPQIKCIVADDPLYGTECDPNFDDNGDGDNKGDPVDTGICPENEPTEGTDCTKNGNTPKTGCKFDYNISGCSSDTLSCSATDTYFCEMPENSNAKDKEDQPSSWKWEAEVMSGELCFYQPDYWPSGSCDPDTFDPKAVLEEAVGPKPTPKPDGRCPDVEPDSGGDCSRTGDTPDGCPYHFIVIGCTAEDLRCAPIWTYFCEFHHDKEGGSWTWQAVVMRRNRRELTIEHCGDKQEDWPSGICDPDTFDSGLLFL